MQQQCPKCKSTKIVTLYHQERWRYKDQWVSFIFLKCQSCNKISPKYLDNGQTLTDWDIKETNSENNSSCNHQTAERFDNGEDIKDWDVQEPEKLTEEQKRDFCRAQVNNQLVSELQNLKFKNIATKADLERLKKEHEELQKENEQLIKVINDIRKIVRQIHD